MHLAHLALTNVRTFRRLELELEPGLHVITGPNAGGKTNLLEAILLLATARSLRGDAEDLISWDALSEEPLPVARVSGRVEAADGPTTLEVAVIARPGPEQGRPSISRRFRVNGIARRASDLIGRLRAVMFSAADLGIIAGSPQLRRRYLDITISQFDRAYVRALQRYGRVLRQRNSLLRRLQEGRRGAGGGGGELDFWDDELAATGAVVLAARARALSALARAAAARYAELAPSGERFEVGYRPALPPELERAVGEPALEERFRAALADQRATDIRAGMTRIGPHRDDVAFLIAERDAGAFASRGEQRSAALALRLAEVELSTANTGAPPLLLLDDILAELDAERRERVLAVAYGVDQVVVTSTDASQLGRDSLPDARRYRVADGEVVPD